MRFNNWNRRKLLILIFTAQKFSFSLKSKVIPPWYLILPLTRLHLDQILTDGIKLYTINLVKINISP